jgi:phosphoribosylanthranilate isomerase
MRTRIKVCGVTRPEDARLVVALGIDALGFVFWPRSPRYVTAAQAAAIASALPPMFCTVGVFVDQPVEEVRRIASEVGLSAVQLHGDEPLPSWMRVPGICIKAVGGGAGADPASIAAWPPHVYPLVDAVDPMRRGGTGQTADWAAAAALARVRPTVLAGGLDAGNVADAIARVRPYAVDVSSGVERSPGIKDSNRLRAFVEAVAAADAAREP